MKISKTVITWAAVLVILFVQAPHLANEFSLMSQLPDKRMQIAHGIVFAIAIDFAVFIFAIQGRVWQTLLFMIASFVITLKYYDEYLSSDNLLLSGTTVMIAAIGVLAVFFLSMEAKASDSDSPHASKKQWQVDRESLLAKIREQNETITGLRNDIQERDKELMKADVVERVVFDLIDVEIIKLKALKTMTHGEIAELIRNTHEIDCSEEYVDEVVQRFRSLYQNL